MAPVIFALILSSKKYDTHIFTIKFLVHFKKKINKIYDVTFPSSGFRDISPSAE